ncbi:MAG: hypothetical protein MI755_10365 [Sphingomonadales bacterium]|nr:hypothetical protein [Sphingomonadales bacterium]
MIRFGFILVVAGFLSAAFVASLDPEAVDWTFFVAAIGAGVIGVVIVKRAQKAAAHADHVLEGNRRDLTESLAAIIANLRELNGRKATVPVDELRHEIDRLFREDLNRFVDARESMVPLFGLQAYADIQSAFAAGERYVNRVWSASADGYQAEALAYLDKALTQFEEAQAKFDAAATA